MNLGKTVLLIGSGGREHAMAWKLSRSPALSRLIVVPGNDGMSPEWERWALPVSSRADFEAIARRALAEKVDLAVIGPDNQLADGIVDVFEKAGLLTFGPTAAAARIESSKAFAKDVMEKAGIPTARCQIVRSADEARKFLEGADWKTGWVIKADGLAFGKGVQICSSLEEGRKAIEALKALGEASNTIVIEEMLQGEEISWFAFSDGERCSLFEPARDHKRVFDGDQGPNTGGMGAFSPVPGVPASFAERVKKEVFIPALEEMRRRGAPFKGLLYAGLMVDFAREKFWVLEFNCRFGDPETQVVLTRMKDDLLSWCEAVARGNISALGDRVGFVSDAAVVVIAAAKGYPEKPEKGASIEGALAAPDFFCAGVARDQSGKFLTAGGRVFGAMGTGPSLEEARVQAYRKLEKIRFQGMHFRADIARKAAR